MHMIMKMALFSKLYMPISGTSMKWFREPTTPGMVSPQEYSLITLILPIPWWEHWELGQYGLIASIPLMLQFLLVAIRWVELEGKRENTVWRVTCKWKQLLPLSKIQHGCELSEVYIHKLGCKFHEFDMMMKEFHLFLSFMLSTFFIPNNWHH